MCIAETISSSVPSLESSWIKGISGNAWRYWKIMEFLTVYSCLHTIQGQHVTASKMLLTIFYSIISNVNSSHLSLRVSGPSNLLEYVWDTSISIHLIQISLLDHFNLFWVCFVAGRPVTSLTMTGYCHTAWILTCGGYFFELCCRKTLTELAAFTFQWKLLSIVTPIKRL